VVEDEERLAALTVQGLRRAGFAAEAVHRAGEARERIFAGTFDAVVLDLGLPDEDGIALLKEMREAEIMVPVVILTTRITVADRVAGLNAGADDYVTKPFALEELVARLRALLRRPAVSLGDVLKLGNLAFDTQTRACEVGGVQAVLTPKEQMLLELLMRKPGAVTSKVLLEDSIYGTGREGASNSLEVLIHRLRARLRELGADVVIHTIRGVGYMITADDADGK